MKGEETMEYQEVAYCPFYLGNGDRRVHCEGFGTCERMEQWFISGSGRDRWYSRVCCRSAYRELCPAAAMLDALWDEDTQDMTGYVRRLNKRVMEIMRTRAARRGISNGEAER